MDSKSAEMASTYEEKIRQIKAEYDLSMATIQAAMTKVTENYNRKCCDFEVISKQLDEERDVNAALKHKLDMTKFTENYNQKCSEFEAISKHLDEERQETAALKQKIFSLKVTIKLEKNIIFEQQKLLDVMAKLSDENLEEVNSCIDNGSDISGDEGDLSEEKSVEIAKNEKLKVEDQLTDLVEGEHNTSTTPLPTKKLEKKTFNEEVFERLRDDNKALKSNLKRMKKRAARKEKDFINQQVCLVGLQDLNNDLTESISIHRRIIQMLTTRREVLKQRVRYLECAEFV